MLAAGLHYQYYFCLCYTSVDIVQIKGVGCKFQICWIVWKAARQILS